MSIQRNVLLLTSLLCVVASCATPGVIPDTPQEGFAGTWVMYLGDRPFMVMTLRATGDRFEGSMKRPARFETSNGVRFANLTAEISTENLEGALEQKDTLHLTGRNSTDETDRNEYDITLLDTDVLDFRVAAVPIEPLKFVRVKGEVPAVATDWEAGRSYSTEDNLPSNPEVAEIYKEDQAARQDFTAFSLDAENISRQDAVRRAQVRNLLAEGQLHTGEDFRLAAFIFQHGDTPEDYLLAHTLAMVAAAKGDEGALWIGAATLDRYLQAIGKPQVFGTQFKEKADHSATLEPYDRNIVDDALRRQLAVPTLAVQEQQLQDWTENFRAAASQKP